MQKKSGKGPTYACCTFRGSIVAMDAATGDVVWRAYTIAEPAKMLGKRADGVEAWGPAGGAIWSAPTIDVKRHAIYVGVGNTYSGPITQPGANAVAAFDLKATRPLWTRQVSPDDIFGCRPGEANFASTKPGPDFDFGSAPALARAARPGRDLIIIGNKSGVGYAMNPDKHGEIVWECPRRQGRRCSAESSGGAGVDAENA